MKGNMKILVIMLAFTLCSCTYFKLINYAFQDSPSLSIQNETEDSIKSFAIVGKTTNVDILRRFKKPRQKSEFSDGRFAYIYSYEYGIRGYIDTKIKYVTFTFSSDNILEKIDYIISHPLAHNKRVNKYDSFEDVFVNKDNFTGELNQLNYNSIVIEETKAQVMRKCGVPTFAFEDDDDDDIEYWTYSASDKMFMCYNFEFRKNRLYRKYTTKFVCSLTTSEKQILNSKVNQVY